MPFKNCKCLLETTKMYNVLFISVQLEAFSDASSIPPFSSLGFYSDFFFQILRALRAHLVG